MPLIAWKVPNSKRNSCSLAKRTDPLSPKNIPQSEWAINKANIIITPIAPPDTLVIKWPSWTIGFAKIPPTIIPNPANISPHATK